MRDILSHFSLLAWAMASLKRCIVCPIRSSQGKSPFSSCYMYVDVHLQGATLLVECDRMSLSLLTPTQPPRRPSPYSSSSSVSTEGIGMSSSFVSTSSFVVLTIRIQTLFFAF